MQATCQRRGGLGCRVELAGTPAGKAGGAPGRKRRRLNCTAEALRGAGIRNEERRREMAAIDGDPEEIAPAPARPDGMGPEPPGAHPRRCAVESKEGTVPIAGLLPAGCASPQP